jgi:hypothetical protein
VGKLRYSLPLSSSASDPERLRENIRRYWTLLDRNSDPTAMQTLRQLIAEAEARLTSLRRP